MLRQLTAELPALRLDQFGLRFRRPGALMRGLADVDLATAALREIAVMRRRSTG
jgi:hypothetical protein